MEKLEDKYGFTTEENVRVLYLVHKEKATIPFNEGIQKIKNNEFELFNLQASKEDEKLIESILYPKSAE